MKRQNAGLLVLCALRTATLGCRGLLCQSQRFLNQTVSLSAALLDGQEYFGNAADEVLRLQQQKQARAFANKAMATMAGVGLFMVLTHSRTLELSLHARILALSQQHWVVATSDMLLMCNDIAVSRAMLLNALRSYPQQLRMLIHTRVNLGYRCGHMHAMLASATVWSPYPWICYTSGPDIYLMPPFIAKMGVLLPDAAKHGVGLIADPFSRWPGSHSTLSMDVFVIRPHALVAANATAVHISEAWLGNVELHVEAGHAATAFANATATCLATLHNPERLLFMMAKSLGLKMQPVGAHGRVNRRFRTAPRGGVWHTHNTSAVQAYLSESKKNKSSWF
eukprot:CAMPEP_0119311408 /NCGR_PEP_ID=MMETSP1333-20130426/22303_1 /TAXON_ID=418940 /ORGANISM="Scyphosphaera apsteinii, Strain RCC1455" /LENGTH=336 /DNA_ID=CAMNT_0007315771 /DNA_START=80 /DNA_END=1090 /DNA_ORIENTATION=-